MDKNTNLVFPDKEYIQFILTDGLQMSKVIDDVLDFTGPAEIIVSTFSASEEFLTHLHVLKKKGLVHSAKLFLDHKAAEKTSKLSTFMQNVFDSVSFIRNHSKVLLVSGVKGVCIVMTSQNLTRGNRLENYVIYSDKALHGDVSGLMSDLAGTLDGLEKYQPWK